MKQKRNITLILDYGTIEITNLKEIWVNKYLGTYRLCYSDNEYEYNCIYWSYNRSYMHELKEKFEKAIQNNQTSVRL